MNKIIQIFMERDGMTAEDAKDEFNILSAEFNSILCNMDLEDMLEGSEEIDDLLADYGLEPDYIDYLL